jgi:hypothetical protein
VKNGKRYYSVSYSVKIGGVSKRPAVCYALTDDVAAAVLKLAEDGRARIYDEEVRFVSGRELPVRRAPTPVSVPVWAAPTPAPTAPAPVSVPVWTASAPALAPTAPAPVAFSDVPDPAAEDSEQPVDLTAGEAGADGGQDGQRGDSAENEESSGSDEGLETGRKPRRTK